jgi:hypothetical protein
MESPPQQNTNQKVERDYQRYHQLLELWSRENTIKTQKLQYFLLTNALLVIGFALTPNNSQESLHNAVIPATGAALALIWTLSLGRTILFQKRWAALMRDLSEQHQDDNRFQILTTKPPISDLSFIIRLTGGVSSKYYLIGAPLVALVFWLWLYSRAI